MPDFRDLDPARLKPGLVTADGDLKPGLVTPAYTGGRPTAANQVKPSLLLPNGDLKPGLILGDDLKPSLVTGAAPASLLLDTFPGAAVAWSLRKLRNAYTGACLRVRRSSDNAELDIGFSGNALNTSELLFFCGAGNGFVTRWYDQSENANNATQATTTQQPQIVLGGSLLTIGSLPAVRSIGQRLNFSAFSAPQFSLFSVFRIDAAAGWCSFIQNVGATAGFKNISRQASSWQSMVIPYATQSEIVANGRASTVNNSVPTARRLESWIFNPATHRANGSAVTVNSDVMAGWGNGVGAIGAMSYLGDPFSAVTAFLQECIVFPTNQSSNASTIETDINSYWGVY